MTLLGRCSAGTIATIVMVATACLMVCVFFSDRAQDRAGSRGSDRTVENWAAENTRGIWIGNRDAQVVITEFLDFQCRFCATHAARIDTLLAEFGGAVAVVFHHFPLTIHPLSLEAAIASECANRQGRFAEFRRMALSQQDSLGLKSWLRFGEEIDMPDLDAFGRCVRHPPDSFPRIAEGRELARRSGASGTPTVWVNGRIAARKDLESLRKLVLEASAH